MARIRNNPHPPGPQVNTQFTMGSWMPDVFQYRPTTLVGPGQDINSYNGPIGGSNYGATLSAGPSNGSLNLPDLDRIVDKLEKITFNQGSIAAQVGGGQSTPLGIGFGGGSGGGGGSVASGSSDGGGGGLFKRAAQAGQGFLNSALGEEAGAVAGGLLGAAGIGSVGKTLLSPSTYIHAAQFLETPGTARVGGFLSVRNSMLQEGLQNLDVKGSLGGYLRNIFNEGNQSFSQRVLGPVGFGSKTTHGN